MRTVSMQPGPADKLYVAAVQVEILCQYGLDALPIFRIIHRFVQLDDTTEFVTTHVTLIGQNELRVVFGRHGYTVRQPAVPDCELSHKKPDFGRGLPE